MDALVSKLKYERIKQGLSQEVLGRRCGFPQSAIAAIESGKRSITLRTLYRLCEALNVLLSDMTSQENPFKKLDRYRMDQIARQVITQERVLSPLENDLSNRVESMVLTKLRALKVPRRPSQKVQRIFALKRWRDLKQMFPQEIILPIFKRVDKYLWKYTHEKPRH